MQANLLISTQYYINVEADLVLLTSYKLVLAFSFF